MPENILIEIDQFVQNHQLIILKIFNLLSTINKFLKFLKIIHNLQYFNKFISIFENCLVMVIYTPVLIA